MQQFFQKFFLHFLSRWLNSHTSLRLQITLSVIIFSSFFLSSLMLFAQQTSMPEGSNLVKSMGLPQIWKPYFSPMISWDKREFDGTVKGEINLGIYKDIINPITGLLGIAGEGYVRTDGGKIDRGVRLLTTSRLLLIQGGIDYSFHNEDLGFLMSFMVPLRRGGLLRKGDSFRLDWFPGQSRSISLGLSIPLGQPYMGKTRPTSADVALPRESLPGKSVYMPEPELQEALANLRHAAYWINQFTTPLLERKTKKGKSDIATFMEMIKELKNHIHLKDHLYPNGHTFEAEIDVYHRELEKAFLLVTWRKRGGDGETSGARIALKAREILLNEVILPYDQLLGQRKEPKSVLGLGSRAARAFKAWIKASPDIPTENHTAVMYVFQTLIKYIDENRARSQKIWDDSRFVWIPLHYALRLEDHDTERELDAIIEKATQQVFTDANDVHYVINELFQPELERMVHKAEDYHILWIHDYRGLNEVGEPDEISYRQTLAYLQALTNKVRAYEVTRKIPVYMIFLDQHYFEINHSRLWLKLLEDPLRHKLHLPPKFREWEKTIRKAQNELRSAVAQSPTLQADAWRYGKEWLNNQIKVHISITNPSDLSFRTGAFFKYFPFVPDNFMRDHRKITFYDVTELDPGKGEAMCTGMGIGEHYTGPTWDDRSILIRGPALLSLKNAARELLLSQGFDETEIPKPLRQLTKPENYDEMLEELRLKGWTAVAMQVYNATGFGPKSANIIKAALYELMPKGSHIYSPCSLWIGPFWGAMLLGAALRGCVTLVVSPSCENAPSDGIPQMCRANELFTRFVIIQNQMHEEIESAGGLFKVGIYNSDVDVGDITGKLRSLNEGIAQSEVFQKVFPFAPGVVQMVAKMPEFLKSQGFEPSYLSEDAIRRKPKLHLKCQFFASERTINTVVPLEGWEPVVRKYILARVKQTMGRMTDTNVDVKELREELGEDASALIASWRGSLTQEERDKAFLYLTVGSHNQDYRSMIMDGEELVVIGHYWAMVAYLDFVSLMAQTTWVTDVQQLEELLPPRGGFWRAIGRFLKNLL